MAVVVSLQSQVSKQDAELKAVQSERDALAGQLEGMRAQLDTAASLAEHHVRLNLTHSSLRESSLVVFVALYVASLTIKYEPCGCSSLRRTICRLHVVLVYRVEPASEIPILRQQYQPASWLCSRKGWAIFYMIVIGLLYMAHPMVAGINYKLVHSPAQGLDVWCFMHKHVILCADLQNGQQHLHEGNAQQAHAAQLRELQAAHEQQVRNIQQAAQQSQADLQAAHAVESRIMQEAHAADMKQLQELREALPQAIAQASSEARHPQDLSTSEIGTSQPTDRLLCSIRKQSEYRSSTDLPRSLLGLQADHMCLWQLADQGGQ